jgi:hypothetical protein
MSDLDDEYWLANFSMSNGEVRDFNDVAGLWREVAKKIEQLGIFRLSILAST